MKPSSKTDEKEENAVRNDPLEKMLKIMELLRSEDGCPWDREQTHQSLKPHLIEESYEVLEALEEEDMEKLKEELGDLFLQILFHSQLAREKGFFSITDVIETLTQKIIRRHPHVFSDLVVSNSDEVRTNWDRIKREEKSVSGKTLKNDCSVLDGIPKALPSLIHAHNVQNRAARVGFDFSNLNDAVEKVDEEMAEFKDAVSRNNQNDIEEEFGDLLFALVNASRFVGVDPEAALKKAVAKFSRRFRTMEKSILSSGGSLENASLKDMDAEWNKIKNSGG